MSLTPPLILAFDTSSAQCAVALLRNCEIIAQKIEPMAKGQAERLLPLCEEVLSSQNTTWAQLTAIGVCTGPGNFTGVRIGVSAARGLALSLQIPAIGVSQLDAMAHGSKGDKTVLLDARRDRAYVQSYTDGFARDEPELIAVADHPKTDLIINPADQITEHIAAFAPPINPIADSIAFIAKSRMGRENPRPAPLYLQEPNAALPSDPPPKILP